MLASLGFVARAGVLFCSGNFGVKKDADSNFIQIYKFSSLINRSEVDFL